MSKISLIHGKRCHSIDLTYALNDSTIFWPGGDGFQLCMSCSIDSKFGYDYAAGTFSCAEHGGTHVDAPFHFAKDGRTVDQLPLNELISSCVLIDVARKCLEDSQKCYRLSAADILEHESTHGVIEPASIVLIKTGWHKYWKEGTKAYLGHDEMREGTFDGENHSLAFPGIGKDAAELFVERKVAGVGLDTASLDAGDSKDFIAHRILLGNQIYGIENINEGIELIPARGATLMVLPMKISGGSGAPARVVAILPP